MWKFSWFVVQAFCEISDEHTAPKSVKCMVRLVVSISIYHPHGCQSKLNSQLYREKHYINYISFWYMEFCLSIYLHLYSRLHIHLSNSFYDRCIGSTCVVDNIDGLVQERRNYSALVMALRSLALTHRYLIIYLGNKGIRYMGCIIHISNYI